MKLAFGFAIAVGTVSGILTIWLWLAPSWNGSGELETNYSRVGDPVPSGKRFFLAKISNEEAKESLSVQVSLPEAVSKEVNAVPSLTVRLKQNNTVEVDLVRPEDLVEMHFWTSSPSFISDPVTISKVPLDKAKPEIQAVDQPQSFVSRLLSYLLEKIEYIAAILFCSIHLY
jgi:hypothetical protein